MKLRAHCLVGVIVVLLLASSAAYAAFLSWAKYVSVDGSFSFHYPEGWGVTESDSTVVMDGPSTDEQLCMCILPYYRNWNPEEHAQLMLSALRSENPDLAASGWETDSEGRAALSDLTHGDGSQQYRGMGLVLKDSGADQALWFHYIAPSSGYSRDRGASTLQGFISSDRERARSIIAKPAPERGSGDASHGAMSTDGLNARMWAHQNMLWASQNTFNHWMWRQGFRSTAFGY